MASRRRRPKPGSAGHLGPKPVPSEAPNSAAAQRLLLPNLEALLDSDAPSSRSAPSDPFNAAPWPPTPTTCSPRSSDARRNPSTVARTPRRRGAARHGARYLHRRDQRAAVKTVTPGRLRLKPLQPPFRSQLSGKPESAKRRPRNARSSSVIDSELHIPIALPPRTRPRPWSIASTAPQWRPARLQRASPDRHRHFAFRYAAWLRNDLETRYKRVMRFERKSRENTTFLLTEEDVRLLERHSLDFRCRLFESSAASYPTRTRSTARSKVCVARSTSRWS